MKAKAIKSISLACVALLFASCASDPYYGNSNYGGGGYPSSGRIDANKTAALVAAGVAGLSLYHYGREKDRRKAAERANAYHQPSYGHNSYNRGYDPRYGGGYYDYGYSRNHGYHRY